MYGYIGIRIPINTPIKKKHYMWIHRDTNINKESIYCLLELNKESGASSLVSDSTLDGKKSGKGRQTKGKMKIEI